MDDEVGVLREGCGKVDGLDKVQQIAQNSSGQCKRDSNVHVVVCKVSE